MTNILPEDGWERKQSGSVRKLLFDPIHPIGLIEHPLTIGTGNIESFNRVKSICLYILRMI